jgi:rhodanese-related sulfurtransferase
MAEQHPLADPRIEVTPEQAAQALADGSAQVVDVREPYEREAGHIPGTRHIELERLASEAPTIDPDRPVIFHCRLGARSLLAAQAFRRAGFEAWSMAGGIEQWSEEGRPIEPEGGYVAEH